MADTSWACCQLLSPLFCLLGDPCLHTIQLTKPVSSVWLTSPVCRDFQVDLFEDASKICLSSPDMIVWAAHLLPISSQNTTEKKLTPSSIKWVKKNSNTSADLQDPSQDSKRKCKNNYHCTFLGKSILGKRPTSFCPLKFTGLESFSLTEACMTCQLSYRCDLFWNEETCSVFSPAASCMVKPIENCGGSSGMLFLSQPSANTSY